MDYVYSYLRTLPFHVLHIVYAFLAYEAIFVVASPAISRAVASKVYSTLDTRSKVNWNMRVVAFIQSIFICGCALAIIRTDPERRKAGVEERLWAYWPSSGKVQAFAAGYFLWDVVVCLQYLSVTGPSALVHALCAFGITLLGFVSPFVVVLLWTLQLTIHQRPFANFYGINFVLYELSTPFLNIHWALDKANLTGSNYQLINGLLLMFTFAACRLFWGTLQTLRLSQDIYSAWGSEWIIPNCGLLDADFLNSVYKLRTGRDGLSCEEQAFPTVLVSIYLISNSILTFLNFMWFGKMLKALRKRLV